MKKMLWLWLVWLGLNAGKLAAENNQGVFASDPTNSSGRLSIPAPHQESSEEIPFEIPRPAHVSKAPTPPLSASFHPVSSRTPLATHPRNLPAPADYLLPERNEKPEITPENSNLNLPNDLEIITSDTGEKIMLPAGTYRQILQLPIDSPFMKETSQIRRDQARPVEVETQKSRYAEPEKRAVWVRYESLEKIQIGEAERRGGIDLPAHGPQGLGPRIWYAKSETADLASSAFYFVFGGLGYSTANLLGWSAGNTREIPSNFEYRLIRR